MRARIFLPVALASLAVALPSVADAPAHDFYFDCPGDCEGHCYSPERCPRERARYEWQAWAHRKARFEVRVGVGPALTGAPARATGNGLVSFAFADHPAHGDKASAPVFFARDLALDASLIGGGELAHSLHALATFGLLIPTSYVGDGIVVRAGAGATSLAAHGTILRWVTAPMLQVGAVFAASDHHEPHFELGVHGGLVSIGRFALDDDATKTALGARTEWAAYGRVHFEDARLDGTTSVIAGTHAKPITLQRIAACALPGAFSLCAEAVVVREESFAGWAGLLAGITERVARPPKASYD